MTGRTTGVGDMDPKPVRSDGWTGLPWPGMENVGNAKWIMVVAVPPLKVGVSRDHDGFCWCCCCFLVCVCVL